MHKNAQHILHDALRVSVWAGLPAWQVGGNARKTNKDYTAGTLPELVDIIIEEKAGWLNQRNEWHSPLHIYLDKCPKMCAGIALCFGVLWDTYLIP